MPPVQIGSQTSWTPQERWVWNKVCEKEIADFNREAAYGGPLDPKNPEEWNSDRILSAEFLQTVLLSEPYRDVIPATGVRISGAWFQDFPDFSFVTLSHVLWLMNCRFESDVLLRRLETPRLILFSGSKFVGKLNMNSVKIGQDLLMHEGAEFAAVDLTGARIDGVLDTMSSKFTGKLNMGSLRVGQRLLMGPRAEFAEVDLIGAKIEGQVDMIGSKFTGKLEMNNLHVGQSLLMRDKADFAEVGLTGAKIEGQVDMSGSKFSGNLNMGNLRAGESLFMRDGAEFAEVRLTGAKIEGQVDMRSSKFTGKLDMASLQVGQGLFMRDNAQFGQVELTAAKIDGQIDMRGSKFTGKLDMNSLHTGHLFMRDGAEFAEVELAGAKIEGVLDTMSSKFTGKLNMVGLRVGQHLLMAMQAEFAEVDLSAAKIGGVVSMIGSKFTGKLNMNSLQAGQHLFMREKAEFAWLGKEYPICLVGGEIGGDMDISDSQFPSLDLTGTKIHGELRLGSGIQKPVRWHQEATLILRNTDVGALQDTEDAWPGKITLDGFSYSRLGSLAGDFSEIVKRKPDWFTKWLAKSEYSPQPYEQLGEVLRKAGYKETANQVLYAGKQREKKGSGWRRCLWMFLQDVFIGYGFKLECSLYWVIILTAVGMVFLTLSDQGPTPHSALSRFFYTLDRLLPFIQLDKAYDDVTLTGYTQIYFYLHKILGYFLGFFIIAGLSGLTKK